MEDVCSAGFAFAFPGAKAAHFTGATFAVARIVFPVDKDRNPGMAGSNECG